MIRSTSSRTDRRRRLLPILFWLLLWQLAGMSLGQSILLATPLDAGRRLLVLAQDAAFWQSVLFSLGHILLGFTLALTVGVLLAALSTSLSWVEDLFAPLLKAVRSVPVASFIIVALIWIPSRRLSILISFLIALPVIESGAKAGIRGTDPQLLEMADVFRMPLPARLRHIYAPALLPQLQAASTVAIGLAWKSGIAAEVIGIPRGSIGERLYQAKIYLATPDLFAWTITIVCLSALCERLLSLVFSLLRRCLK